MVENQFGRDQKTVVFCGPTISASEVLSILPAHIEGPVSQGDVYRVYTDQKPYRIIIIDGVYENVPAVWHKEILYVMSKGVLVYGAASMGALRAAELDAFGMIGFGKIYEMYRDGLIEDDDEVAVLHGPADLGYPAVSIAMVNIRETVTHGLKYRVIDERLATYIIQFFKSTFYKNRNLQILRTDTFFKEVLTTEHLIWLQENFVDQKKNDALELLTALSLGTDFRKSRPDFSFLNTAYFQENYLRRKNDHQIS